MDRELLKTSLPRTIIRVEAKPSSDVLAVVPTDTELEVLAEVDAFVQVSVWVPEQGRVTGYVEGHKLGLKQPRQEGEDELELPCICGATDWRGVDYRTGDRFYYPLIRTGFLTVAYLKSRICANCGRLEQYLGKTDLEELRKAPKA